MDHNSDSDSDEEMVDGVLSFGTKTDYELPSQADLIHSAFAGDDMEAKLEGIAGDGRCLFRSIAHGACICSGKPSPDKALQKALADKLRAMVADEFVRRRPETEWFVEGDFDTYITQIRKPHVWGGEADY